MIGRRSAGNQVEATLRATLCPGALGVLAYTYGYVLASPSVKTSSPRKPSYERCYRGYT